jgi:two-component system, NarL family, nitrate/nitrite response regulator NarL
MGDSSQVDTAPDNQIPLAGREAKEITIAVIEDNRLMREGISALLNQVPRMRVVAAWSSGDLSLLEQVNPHVVLLDLGLRNGDSLRVAQTVRRDLPESRVIVMDLLPAQEEIMDFVHAGVSGFIMKDATLEDLVNTIQCVAEGAHVLPPQMTGSLFSQIAREAVASSGPQALEAVRMTPRERQVISLISEGLGNKQIAARLHIATHTVKSHVRNIMEKLALHTRLQIAAYAHNDELE